MDTPFLHRFIPRQIAEEERTLLLLHGTGGDENYLLPLGRQLLPGAALLSPRGRVSENGMPRFFRRLAEGVFDQEDMRLRTEELVEFIQAASKEYGLEAGRIVAAGFSNGANIAASVLLRRPGILAAAVLLHPMVPFEPEPLPDLKGVPIFLGAGRQDPIVPIENTERLFEIFSASGAEVQLFWQAGGHSLGREEFEAARKWLAADKSA